MCHVLNLKAISEVPENRTLECHTFQSCLNNQVNCGASLLNRLNYLSAFKEKLLHCYRNSSWHFSREQIICIPAKRKKNKTMSEAFSMWFILGTVKFLQSFQSVIGGCVKEAWSGTSWKQFDLRFIWFFSFLIRCSRPFNVTFLLGNDKVK